MRISDWSSDVCSSDLYAHRCHELFLDVQRHFGEESENRRVAVNRALQVDDHGSKLMCGNGRPIRGVHRRQHLSYSVCHHSTHNTILFGSLFSYSLERFSKQASRSGRVLRPTRGNNVKPIFTLYTIHIRLEKCRIGKGW